MMAREEVMAKNQQAMQEQAMKFGGQVPPELMQQFQAQNEIEIAERIVQMTEELVAEEQQYLEGQGTDPLIDLKKQELMLRAQEIQQNKENADKKLELDAEKLNFEGQKLAQKDEMDKERLQSQEDQANLRAEVALQGQRRRDGTQ
jgi:hypothetical protein